VNRHEQYTGWKIVVGFLARDLDLDDGAFDVGESAQRYSNLCVEALRRAYPGAEIQVAWSLDETGRTPRGVTAINPEGFQVDADAVRKITTRIRDAGEWRVRKVTATELSPPVPLGCDYWFNERTKCAEHAVVRLTAGPTRNDEVAACKHHQDALRKTLAEDAPS
jgi:hypothetical protein